MGRSRGPGKELSIWGKGGGTLKGSESQCFHNKIRPYRVCWQTSASLQLETAYPDYSVFSTYTDKLTEEEFIEGTLANKEILRLIQFEPQKVKERLKEKEKNP